MPVTGIPNTKSPDCNIIVNSICIFPTSSRIGDGTPCQSDESKMGGLVKSDEARITEWRRGVNIGRPSDERRGRMAILAEVSSFLLRAAGCFAACDKKCGLL